MRINIEFVRMNQMRYPSVGDYWYDDDGTLQLRVVDSGDEFFNKMVLIHELTEEALTKKRGLSEQEITDYDLAFEAARKLGLRNEIEEPGFGNGCPYIGEHSLATSFEMAMCGMAGVRWTDYEYVINSL